MIFEGLKLTVRNIGLIVFPIAAMLVLYLSMSAAVFTALPASEVQKLVSSNLTYQQMGEKIVGILEKNMEKTLISFLLFGIIALIAGEFLSASMIAAARDAVMTGSFSFKKAVEDGFVYTPPVLLTDLLCSLGAIAFLMPLYVVYYVTGVKTIVSVAPLLFMFVAPLLTLPKYVVVIKGESVINSLVDGFRIAIANYPQAFTAVIFCSLIVLAATFVPLAVPLASAFSASLLSVYMSAIVVGEVVV